MKVIFIKDLKNQGKKGQIKEVKDGFAKNYLIKNGYAVQETTESKKQLDRETKKAKELDEQNRDEANKLKQKLEKRKYSFKAKTGDHDKVFGSISVKQIKEELDKTFKIDKKQINIPDPIQSLGFHNVEINLYKDIKAIIKIEVTK